MYRSVLNIHSLYDYRRKYSLRGTGEYFSFKHIQQKIFRGDIDLVFAAIDVKKLKETATLRYWRQWRSLLYLFFFLLTFGIVQPPPHPTPKFNCSVGGLSSASVCKETGTNIHGVHTAHKTFYEKLYVTF